MADRIMELAYFILNIKTQGGHCRSALRTVSYKQEDPKSTVSHVISENAREQTCASSPGPGQTW